ncbi:MAG: hypothetical protein IJR63_05075 [Synergistaceae bacterium]|nr:hypothetical protein [Synergistaceae bacterium]
MKKAFLLLLLMMTAVTAEGYEISGTWNIYGTGFVEKSFVRISLELRGGMELSTCKVSELSYDIIEVLSNDTVTVMRREDVDQNLDCLNGYEIDLRLYAFDKTGLDIKIWDDNLPNGIRIPIVFPDFTPTVNNPFVLPAVIHNGISYQVSFTSETSGKVRIRGYFDTDYVGDIEINSDCAIWKSGTARPVTDSETSSGCDSGAGVFALMILLAGVKKFVRN